MVVALVAATSKFNKHVFFTVSLIIVNSAHIFTKKKMLHSSAN